MSTIGMKVSFGLVGVPVVLLTVRIRPGPAAVRLSAGPGFFLYYNLHASAGVGNSTFCVGPSDDKGSPRYRRRTQVLLLIVTRIGCVRPIHRHRCAWSRRGPTVVPVFPCHARTGCCSSSLSGNGYFFDSMEMALRRSCIHADSETPASRDGIEEREGPDIGDHLFSNSPIKSLLK